MHQTSKKGSKGKACTDLAKKKKKKASLTLNYRTRHCSRKVMCPRPPLGFVHFIHPQIDSGGKLVYESHCARSYISYQNKIDKKSILLGSQERYKAQIMTSQGRMYSMAIKSESRKSYVYPI